MSLGFIHIPRTGGTYLSGKMRQNGIMAGWRDMELMRLGHDWHTVPRPEVRAKRDKWFCIVRDPYSRIISELRWACRRHWYLDALTPPKMGHFCMQTSLSASADIILRYETLPESANQMLQEEGLGAIDFSDFRPVRHSPDEAIREKIYQLYRDDFEILGYKK